jgi:hypothetical protein
VSETTERPRVNWQAVVVTSVAGVLFHALGSVTGNQAIWSAAAAICFIAAADSLWRHRSLPNTAA